MLTMRSDGEHYWRASEQRLPKWLPRFLKEKHNIAVPLDIVVYLATFCDAAWDHTTNIAVDAYGINKLTPDLVMSFREESVGESRHAPLSPYPTLSPQNIAVSAFTLERGHKYDIVLQIHDKKYSHWDVGLQKAAGGPLYTIFDGKNAQVIGFHVNYLHSYATSKGYWYQKHLHSAGSGSGSASASGGGSSAGFEQSGGGRLLDTHGAPLKLWVAASVCGTKFEIHRLLVDGQ